MDIFLMYVFSQAIKIDPALLDWIVKGLIAGFLGLVVWVFQENRSETKRNTRAIQDMQQAIAVQGEELKHLRDGLADDIADKVTAQIQGLPKTKYK